MLVLGNDEPLMIYECHIGMSSEEGRVSSYREFQEQILPRIVDLGYNAIQIMAVQEHPYYGSLATMCLASLLRVVASVPLTSSRNS